MHNCAQPVHRLGLQRAGVVDLYAATSNQQTSPVYLLLTYASFKPTFILSFMHSFFGLLVSVKLLFIHVIHRTNKDINKFKVIINHRELCI